ncbi:MAG: peptidylprolyl isomerase [Myxococcota bacterium]|nr:peptidylprolyl isomerase [Myxococcota bacterium]
MGRFARGLLLASAIATTACANCRGGPVEQRDAEATATGLTPTQSAQVLARVGVRTITVGDYIAALGHMDQFDRMRYQAPERRQELLGEMIDVMLLADEAREKGYDKDPLVQQEIREILRDAMLKKSHEGAPGPSALPDIDVRAYYQAHKADFHDPERRRGAAIVLGPDLPAGPVLEAARKASSVQWGELVRTKSVDPKAKGGGTPSDLGGDLGFVSPPDDARGANPRVPAEVRAALFEIENVGDVLPRPVKAGSHNYIVKLTSKTDPHDRTFEEAERAIRVKLAQDAIHAKESALLDELRRQYPVQIDESALGEVKVELPRSDGGA